MANRRVVAAGLYRERSDFTDAYQRFSTGEIDNNLINFHAERSEALKKAPPENYAYKPPGEPLPFIYNLAQFRGDNDKTRTELYVGVSSSHLKFQFDRGRFHSRIDCVMLVRDTTFEDADRHTRNVNFEAAEYQNVENKLLMFQENLMLDPGSYSLSIEMDNEQGNTGTYTNPLQVKDFTDSKLMISDLQLASDVVKASEPDEFTKSGLHVTPYPYTVIRKHAPVFVYFEIYNLRLDLTSQTRFNVDYQIRLAERKRSLVARTFRAIGRLFSGGREIGISTSYSQTGSRSWLPQYIALDMGSMPDGMAEFMVTITDQVANSKVSEKIEFQLIE